MAEEPAVSEFTAAEAKFLVTMLKNSNSDINANWDMVASERGYKDGGSARACWNTIHRKKIGKKSEVSSCPPGGVDKSAPNGKKGGAKKVVVTIDAGEKKAGKKRGGGKKKVVASIEGCEDEEDVAEKGKEETNEEAVDKEGEEEAEAEAEGEGEGEGDFI